MDGHGVIASIAPRRVAIASGWYVLCMWILCIVYVMDGHEAIASMLPDECLGIGGMYSMLYVYSG